MQRIANPSTSVRFRLAPPRYSITPATTGPELPKDRPPAPSDLENAGCFGWQASRGAPARSRQSAYLAYLPVARLSAARRLTVLLRWRRCCRNPAPGCPGPLPAGAQRRFPAPVAAGPWAAGPGRDEPRTV